MLFYHWVALCSTALQSVAWLCREGGWEDILFHVFLFWEVGCKHQAGYASSHLFPQQCDPFFSEPDSLPSVPTPPALSNPGPETWERHLEGERSNSAPQPVAFTALLRGGMGQHQTQKLPFSAALISTEDWAWEAVSKFPKGSRGCPLGNCVSIDPSNITNPRPASQVNLQLLYSQQHPAGCLLLWSPMHGVPCSLLKGGPAPWLLPETGMEKPWEAGEQNWHHWHGPPLPITVAESGLRGLESLPEGLLHVVCAPCHVNKERTLSIWLNFIDILQPQSTPFLPLFCRQHRSSFGIGIKGIDGEGQ